MSRSLYHDLYVFLPCTLCQFTQAYQFFNLAHIRGIRQASRTTCVAERDRHVVLPADIQNLIVIFIERILFSRHAHPGKYQRSSAGHNVHLTLMIPDLIDRLSCNSTVQSNEIHSVLRMQADYINKIFCRKRIQISLIVDNRIIHRHSSDHGRALAGQFSAERNRISVGRQIHDRMRAHIYRFHHLLHFNVIVLTVSGNSQIDIDLCTQHGAYSLRIQACVVFVCTDHHFPGGHQRHQFLSGHPLLFRYLYQLWSHNPLSRRFHLCCIFSHHSFSLLVASRIFKIRSGSLHQEHIAAEGQRPCCSRE